MGVSPTVAGVETISTPIEPTADDARRRSWWTPPPLITRRPISTYDTHTAFVASLSAARQRVGDLQYEALDDNAAVAKLRAEIDAIIATRVPMNLEHIRFDLEALRRKLDRPALELWAIAEEPIA